jgi:hypothetical protein
LRSEEMNSTETAPAAPMQAARMDLDGICTLTAECRAHRPTLWSEEEKGEEQQD